MGCVDGGGPEGSGGALFAASPGKASGTRDVEAPEVYQTSDKALWDGRPSLGGIWVAAPNVTNPERAMIVNTANGKSVTGALFKRERDNPGPRLQLSSDAAEALGILAGQPTEIRVTALKKQEVKQPDAPVVAAAAVTDPAAKPAATATAAKPTDAGEAAAIASAALTAVEAGKTGGAAKPGDSALVADPAAVPTEPAKPKTWKERRAEAKAEREAKRREAAEAKAAAAAAKAAAATAATSAATVDGTDTSKAPTATPAAAAAAVAPIESAPLDARKPEAAKPAAAAAKPAKSGTEAPAKTAATPASAAAAAVASAPSAGGANRPIQVASFSKEENATRATEALAKIGITATPQKSERDGKPVWGVVVMGDEAMLQKIKSAGFADAYYLK